MVIVAHALILAIRLFTARHMQGIKIKSTEDIKLFLNSLITLDVLCVAIFAIRPRIENFPNCYRRSIQKEENMQGQPHKKKDQHMKVWRRKEQQHTPTKN